MESLNANEQREFQQLVERRQMKDFMTMYSNLVQRCFDDCINDFTSKAVSTKEETCVNRCVDKFLKTSERLGQRFAEQNQAMMQGGGAGMGK
ncbi:Tim10/DDP family zinc finger protein [Tricharina praecox]|uniref:Tim10/DDP family zinc finger protein n=1 Tax=Tricharina praecox TaxID=43433 RepID=UPI00221EFCFA|nr:Tim10/DDP family zinc finger protein [Tricharina praecox]KAI5854009.1 Tim10/DDP family zinc finger protein [Tricharina praecox]